MSTLGIFEIQDRINRELWSKGVIGDLAYILFALQIGNISGSFDIDRFIQFQAIPKYELSESDLEEGWKPKQLKLRQVLNAIAILEEKGFAAPKISIELTQLDLFT